MRRRSRIYLTGAIAPLALAAGLVPASAAKKLKKPSGPAGTPVNCVALVTTEVPSGQTVVLPSAAKGQQWGTIRCGTNVGSGASRAGFKSPDTGDLLGKFTSWFGAGTMSGTFKLTQQEGALTNPNQFAFVSYTGTLKVTGGTGTFKGAAGTGTATCTSQDGLHFRCRQRLGLTKM